jgi:hypothetical protein
VTSDSLSYFPWLFAKADWIRNQAGHDAAKFEALLDDPALAQEALTQFPDSPLLYSLLQEYLYLERLLARRGIFRIDGPPTEEQDAELARQHAEWARSQRPKSDES